MPLSKVPEPDVLIRFLARFVAEECGTSSFSQADLLLANIYFFLDDLRRDLIACCRCNSWLKTSFETTFEILVNTQYLVGTGWVLLPHFEVQSGEHGRLQSRAGGS